MKRLIAALTVGFLLVSCSAAHAGEKVMYQEITDNKPDVGVSTTVYLGDRMLQQRLGQWQECIVPKFSSAKTMLGVNFVINNGAPICLPDLGSDRYISSYSNIMQLGTTFNKPIKIKTKNEYVQLCAVNICSDLVEKTKIDSGPFFVVAINSIQQTIEYTGRSGDVLKFTYSEFADNFTRQAFTREFQVDLSQGNVAAYKGAVIEIESATNASITYKVVRNFQQ